MPKTDSYFFQQARMYWGFYKETLPINWGISFLLATITYPVPSSKFFLLIMASGAFLSLFYKELSRKNEYYFYYNRGITKLKLWSLTLLLNFFFGLTVYHILELC